MGRLVVVGAATLVIGVLIGIWWSPSPLATGDGPGDGGEGAADVGSADGGVEGGSDGDPGDEGRAVRRMRQGLVEPLLDFEPAESPLLDVEPLLDFEPAESPLLDGVQAAVAAIRDEALASGRVRHLSVYVRDLSSGASFGFDVERAYTPASLGKLPLLMALLMGEELSPGSMQRRVFYPLWLSANDEQSIAPRPVLKPGHEYTLAELAEGMIAESDNNATSLLLEAVDKGLHERVLKDLGLRTLWDIVDDEGYSTVTVRGYALLFRVLYNATYLGEGASVQALTMLGRASLTHGLREGVPAGTMIAHKFGEFARLQQGAVVQQFHDCGIVYHPTRPYLACVMTRGESLGALAEVVAEISRAVWSGVEALPRPSR